jgi:hypothetical protein
MARLFSRPIVLAALVAASAFVVYLFTLAPTVDFIDDGELTTACWTLGICHPTGYPFFTLIGWVFAHLPIASSVILRMNLMAAFFTALGAGGMVMLAYEVFRFWMPERAARPAAKGTQKTKGTKGPAQRKAPVAKVISEKIEPAIKETPHELALFAAFATGIAAAFSSTWWSQSTSIEVYPVHLFLVPIVLTFFLRMLRNEETEKVERDGKLFALVLALSFANHMTTVLLAPACLYMFFARYGFARLSWRRILHLAPFFLAGLAVYLYMPIRSAMFPPMDWGHPSTLGAFLRHVTGGQYKIWMFTGGGAAAKQWSYFWQRVPHEFTIVGALLALTGIYGMFMCGVARRTHVLAFTLLLFFGCLLYAINYDIHDIDSYFLLAFLAVALWVGAGLLRVAQVVVVTFRSRSLSEDSAKSSDSLPNANRGLKPTTTIAIAAALLGAFEIGMNYSEVDESGNYFVEDMTKNMLTNLPPNAIVFSTLWDFWVSGAFYYQMVEHLRPDVLVIDKAMLRDRPWYYAQLAQRAPEVFRRVKPEEDAFLKYLWAFDRGAPFDENAIAPAYEKFTSALVERNSERPIFVTQEMVDEKDDLFAPRMKPVPAGLLWQLVPRDTVIEAPVPKLQWHDKNYRKRDYYTDDSRMLQAMPLVLYAQELLKRGEQDRARAFVDAALTFKPDLGANLDDLNERDRSLADVANERFTQIEALRKQLTKP